MVLQFPLHSSDVYHQLFLYHISLLVQYASVQETLPEIIGTVYKISASVGCPRIYFHMTEC